MNNLKVKIPKKYKRNISYRFNHKNKIKNNDYFIIQRSCPLCNDFFNIHGNCVGCPFNKYQKKYNLENIPGCLSWINNLIIFNNHDNINMNTDYICLFNNKGIENLKELRKKAKELITWI